MAFASGNEDAWIVQQFPRDFVGYAVEVGAWDGMEGSNTLALEHAGWKTLAIEPNPDMEPALKTWRECYRICACGRENLEQQQFHINTNGPAGYSSLRPTFSHPQWHPEPGTEWKTILVPVRTLDALLDEVRFPKLDALSIDTEGTEMDVLAGLSLARWQPKALIIECWDSFGPHIDYLAEYGYNRVERRLVNDLFVK